MIQVGACSGRHVRTRSASACARSSWKRPSTTLPWRTIAPQPASPPDRERAPFLGPVADGDPLLARLDRERRAAQELHGFSHFSCIDRGGDDLARTARTPSAPGRRRVVELGREELHQALVRARERAHPCELLAPSLGDALPASDVRRPGRRRPEVPAAVAIDGLVDLEERQALLESSPPHVELRLEPFQPDPRLGLDHTEHLTQRRLAGERGRDEVVVDLVVLAPVQQHGDRVVEATSEPGRWKWTTNPRSGLSNPIPSATVETSALTTLRRSCSSSRSRSDVSRLP